MSHRQLDPGPPTWSEALAGFKQLRTVSGDRVRAAMARRQDIPPTDAYELGKACETHSAADADWKHWSLMVRRYEAFIALHQAMANAKITAECPHKNACWTGDDDGYYREPGRQAQAREREPGDDDEERYP
jgi:hypothetical protein